MMYPTADELLTNGISDTNLWESRLDYQLVQEILGHNLSEDEWVELMDALDDVVFQTVMSFQR
jgi:hypothetical protein